jgi:hypothetical protein
VRVSDCKQLLIGLPGTGKTTFLAALWYVVDSDEVLGSLQLETLHGDREHLNKIRSDWLSCRTIARTTIASEQLVSMKLTEPSGGRTTEVFFPDMSGESFRLQWKDRAWTKKYDQLVREAAGALLFVHPSTIVEPIRIDTANQLVAELAEEASSNSLAQDELTSWDADRAPTQVQLVELLQFLTVRTGASLPFRVSMIVSAWDLVCNDAKSPEEWLAARLPLLDQYLKANLELFETRIYGVSAQGGDLNKDTDRLQKKHKPSERIFVVGHDGNQHDLTAPVRWVMS